jgi:hypothetical protein
MNIVTGAVAGRIRIELYREATGSEGAGTNRGGAGEHARPASWTQHDHEHYAPRTPTGGYSASRQR